MNERAAHATPPDIHVKVSKQTFCPRRVAWIKLIRGGDYQQRPSQRIQPKLFRYAAAEPFAEFRQRGAPNIAPKIVPTFFQRRENERNTVDGDDGFDQSDAVARREA